MVNRIWKGDEHTIGDGIAICLICSFEKLFDLVSHATLEGVGLLEDDTALNHGVNEVSCAISTLVAANVAKWQARLIAILETVPKRSSSRQ
jgi:hypothetical protein